MSAEVPIDGSHVFLLVFAVLSYRLLFHTERNLNFFSLVLCGICAYSLTQLGMVMFALGPGTWEPVDNTHASMLYRAGVGVTQRVQTVGASLMGMGCRCGLLDASMRASCLETVEWLMSKCSVTGWDFAHFGGEGGHFEGREEGRKEGRDEGLKE